MRGVKAGLEMILQSDHSRVATNLSFTNRSTSLSKLIFSIRSGTLDIKSWNKWNYGDNLCEMCELKEETLEHLMICPEYGERENNWRDIYGNNPEKQTHIAKIVKKRLETRKNKQEAGQDSPYGSHTPTNVVEF